MAHIDHLIEKLNGQQTSPVYREISVCFLVLVHKQKQVTKHSRTPFREKGKGRHKNRRENSKLQETDQTRKTKHSTFYPISVLRKITGETLYYETETVHFDKRKLEELQKKKKKSPRNELDSCKKKNWV